jgi:hypothetical protein
LPLLNLRSFCIRKSLLLPVVLPAVLALTTGFLAPSAFAQDKQEKTEQGAVPPAKVEPPAGGNTVKADITATPAEVQFPAPKFRERPRFVTDPQRLRRSPTIDGVLSEGEWDPFYTIDNGPVKGTVYCNWDDRYLYVAVKSDAASTVLVDLDAGGDGWLRGSDNMEIVVGPPQTAGGTPSVAVRLLDAANSKDTPVWNETGVDPKTILAAERFENGVQVLELAIPKNAGSLVLRPGVNIGLRAEFLPSMIAAAYVPTQPFEPHLLLDATLVEARVVAAQGLNPKLTLSDYKCVQGQKLFATLELFNQTDIAVKIKSVLWTGQGNSVNAVNTFRDVNVPPILGLKRNKMQYKTILPENLALGSYVLQVAVETEDGKRVESSASFSVVEPLQVQISSEPNPVAILGPTKLDVKVDILSAVPDHWRGDVELVNVPAGWESKNGKKHSVLIQKEDGKTISHFNMVLPSNTPAGTYPIEATVTWKSRVWKLRTNVTVIRTDSPVKPSAAPAPPAQTPPAGGAQK